MLGATSSINNYPNVFGIQSGLSVEQLAKTMATGKQPMPMEAMMSAMSAGGSVAAQGSDSVTISSSANMLQQLLNTEMQGSGSAEEMGELDLVGLTQLKQRGEMLASMLQLKMKNFESGLMANMKGAGLPMQDMNIKQGEGGMQLLGDMPNKESIQNAIGGLSGEFSDIARLAEVLNMLKQLGADTTVKDVSGLAGISSATKYAQQSLPDKSAIKRSENDFVMHISQSGTSSY